MVEVGTIIAVIQLADRVIELSKYWIEGVRDAESDLRSILVETSMLKSVLENIQFLSDCSDGLSTTLAGLSISEGPLDHCQRILDEIAKLIPAKLVDVAQQSASPKDKMKLMVAKLGWAARRSTAQNLLDELQRHKAAISLALVTESVQDIKEIKIKTNQVLKALSDAERREFCQWLQDTNPSPLHNRAQEQFEEGPRHPRCRQDHPPSYLVRQLESFCEGKPNSVALYYYCYFANNQNEAGPFLRWITTELCRQTSSIPNSAYRIFDQGRDPSLPELLTALAEITEPFQTIYVVADALDESKPRDDLLKVLRDLVTDVRFDKMQVVATSREYIDIEIVLEDISMPVSMSNPFITQDIALCVKAALQNGPRFRRWPKELLDEAGATLAARAKGMFRWAVCQLDRLRKLKGDATAVRQALRTLPRTLDETYQRIFAEIPEEERDIVRLCLGWIDAHAQLHDSPMPVPILLQVLNSTPGLSQPAPDSAFGLNQEDLREICGCLINITTGQGFKLPDGLEEFGNGPVISFAHYTVREFLSVEDASLRHSARYFMLGDDLWFEIAAYAFTTVLSYDTSQLKHSLQTEGIKSDRLWQIESYDDELVAIRITVAHILGSVTAYCVIYVAELLLNSLPPSPSSGLNPNQRHHVTLALRILDPSQPQIGKISILLAWWFDIFSVPDPSRTTSYFRLWNLEWRNKHGSAVHDAMWLFTVMAGTSLELFLNVLQDFLNHDQNNPSYGLDCPVQFKLQLPNGTKQPKSFPLFDASFLEFVASRPDQHLHRVVLGYLLSRSGIPSSVDKATALLHAHSVAHRHEHKAHQDSTCPFRTLLDLGASPHGRRGYVTTPIQRSVAILDLEGVEMLLEAGADVNDVGNPAGVKAGYDYHLFPRLADGEEFEVDSWVGKSPLWIYYQRPSYKLWDYNESTSRERRADILDLLLRHGAKALSMENGKVVENTQIKSILISRFDEWLIGTYEAFEEVCNGRK